VIEHIDVHALLRRTVCHLYSDLVTRPTGTAVRRGIEEAVADRRREGELAAIVIDFSQVGLVDHSCADEIVAKLLLDLRADGRIPCHVVFRGLTPAHLEAIEPVLEHHGLTMLMESPCGQLEPVGPLSREARQVFDAVAAGADQVDTIAERTGLGEAVAAGALDELHSRRLLPSPPVPGTR